MSRITDRVLVQRVGDEIVFIDELTSDEVAFPVAAVGNVIAAMTYLADPEGDVILSLLQLIKRIQAEENSS
jgi:hypothetical protein